MAVAALVVTILGLIISLVFNALQYQWRQQDRQDRAAERVEQKRRDEETVAEQRRREQAPPQFYNSNGNPGPIRINGIQHSVQGPYVHLWGNVTVVNPTNAPMKISIIRLVLAGEQCELHARFFRPKSDGRQRFEGISLRGNDKEDYEIHFMFSDKKYPMPPTRDGELWLSSGNRQEPFVVPISCP